MNAPEYAPILPNCPADPYRLPQYIEVCRSCDGIISTREHPNRLRLKDEIVMRVCALCWENER